MVVRMYPPSRLVICHNMRIHKKAITRAYRLLTEHGLFCLTNHTQYKLSGKSVMVCIVCLSVDCFSTWSSEEKGGKKREGGYGWVRGGDSAVLQRPPHDVLSPSSAGNRLSQSAHCSRRGTGASHARCMPHTPTENGQFFQMLNTGFTETPLAPGDGKSTP